MVPAKGGLVLTTSQALPFSVIADFQARFSLGSSVQVVTQSGQLGTLDAESASFGAIFSLSDHPGHHTEAVLAELSRVLQPGGVLELQEPVARRQASHDEAKKLGTLLSKLQDQAGLERLLLLAGFSRKETRAPVPEGGLAKEWTGITSASVGSIQGPLLQPLAVKVEKPQWSTGGSFSLKKKAAKSAASAPPASAAQATLRPSISHTSDVTTASESIRDTIPGTSNKSSVWQVAVNDDDMDLVDEDALLTEEDMLRPTPPNNPTDDCGSSGRKACKNCTCGRADMEEADTKTTVKAVLTSDLLDNPQSACGSCGLGDAFRCSGCPYKGLPAFKLGEKISLPTSILTADA